MAGDVKNRWSGRAAFALDLRSLAALRVAWALLLLSDLGIRVYHFDSFYSSAGLLPASIFPELRSYYHADFPWILARWIAETPYAIVGALATLLISGIALGVGYRTRAATFAAWLSLCLVQWRNPVIFAGYDTELRMVLFWSIFLPLGARFSWDGRHSGAKQDGLRHLNIWTVAFTLQIGFIYLFAGIFKFTPGWLLNGHAVTAAVCNPDFGTPGACHLARAFPGVATMLGRATVLVEFGAPLVWWSGAPARARGAALAAVTFLHLGIALCLRVGLFPWVSLAALTALIPSEFWDYFDGAKTAPPAFVPGGCAAEFLATFLIAYVFLLNVSSFRGPYVYIPAGWTWVGETLSLNQSWGIFRDPPKHSPSAIVARSQSIDGIGADLLRGPGPASFEKMPGAYGDKFRSLRWRKYLSQINERNRSLPEVFCRWLSRASGNAPLELWLLREESNPGAIPTVRRLVTCQNGQENRVGRR